MKGLSWISRMLVGALFIVSGLIKANDPTGFSYKLDEYFIVFGTPWMSDFSLLLASFICILEIVLGAAVIFGTRMVTVAWALLSMIVFFTFLTFYSAYFNKVTDCGCFGDALKLTPWQSFSKDVVLLFFVLIIFVRRKYITHTDFRTDIIDCVVALLLIALFSLLVIHWPFPVIFAAMVLFAIVLLKKYFRKMPNTMVLGVSALASLYFTWYCVNHLPVKDFRPYAINKNISDGMSIPAGAPKDSIVMKFQYKKDGVVYSFSADALPEDLDKYEFVDRFDDVIRKGYVPPIHDFTITDVNGADFTESYLHHEGPVFMLVAYDLAKTDKKVQSKINAFVADCDKAGIPFFGLTSTSFEETDQMRHEFQSMFPYFACDATTLKTIIRSNPGLVLLDKGTVKGKWHFNDFPTFTEVKPRLSN